MPYLDMPIDEARQNRIAIPPPDDFEEFWGETIAEARSVARPTVFREIDNFVSRVTTYDVEFSGFGGDPIKAWLHVPSGAERPLPAVVLFSGYEIGRGQPHETMLFALADHVVLVMDNRGQGTWGRHGDTPDPHDGSVSSHGLLTRGILNRDSYFFRRLVTDAVRAVDAVREHPSVDAGRVFTSGFSQGGYLSISAGALGDHVAGIMPNFPALSDLWRNLQNSSGPPLSQLTTFLAMNPGAIPEARATWAYFDLAHLAALGTAPALFSVGLMDVPCPPSTVYAAFNAWGGTKEIVEYPFSGHEGANSWHAEVELQWLRARAGLR